MSTLEESITKFDLELKAKSLYNIILSERNMTKHYTFTCYDSEEKTTTEVAFNTDSDMWSGFDGPMYKFFCFLLGNGFVFETGSEIGIVKPNGQFVSATPDWLYEGADYLDDEI